ncbi:MAG: hypothetical protein K5756_04595 [Clostridiales bacterium]|nr:hypothetical protein [Clostridiales bacterium]
MDINRSVVTAREKELLKNRIQNLKCLMNQYRKNIDYYTKCKNNEDESYKAIIRFKTSLQTSQASFSNASKSKSSALEQVQSVAINNVVARNYYQGMVKVLNGTGRKIITFIFHVLLDRTEREQTFLKSKSQDYEEKINSNLRLLENAQREYKTKVQELEKLQ